MTRLSPVYGNHQEYTSTGLKNLGNTCYMNAIVQYLTHSEALTNYLMSLCYKNGNSELDKESFTSELTFLMIVLLSGQFRIVSPLDPKTKIAELSPVFGRNDQQDAHELLLWMLETVYGELMGDVSIECSQLLKGQFQGQTMSKLVCQSCKYESVIYEDFTCLHVEVPHTPKVQLHECLQKIMKEEEVSGWRCNKCHRKSTVIKKMEITSLPKTLIVQLKRFQYDDLEIEESKQIRQKDKVKITELEKKLKKEKEKSDERNKEKLNNLKSKSLETVSLQFEKAQKECNQLKQKLGGLEKEQDTLRRKAKLVEEENQKLKAENSTHVDIVQNVFNKDGAAKAKGRKVVPNEMNNLQAELNNTEENRSLKGQIDALQKKLEETETKKVKYLKNEITSLKAQIVALEESRNEAAGEVKKARYNQNVCETELGRLKDVMWKAIAVLAKLKVW